MWRRGVPLGALFRAHFGVPQSRLYHERLLGALLGELPLKRAVRVLADATGLPRNRVYARALRLKDEG